MTNITTNPAGGTLAPSVQVVPAPRRSLTPQRQRGHRLRPNYLAGVGVTLWLIITAVPLYMLVKYSLSTSGDYLSSSTPLRPPASLTLENYTYVLQHGFVRYFFNTLIVMAGTVAIVLGCAVPAAYAIVRSPSRLISATFQVFLFGLAIPAQATIIPVYLMMINLGLYDTLIAIILPTAAFSLPISILILVGSFRDVPRETYEAMSLDGASAASIFWHLVLPFGKAAIMTVGIFTALGAWNGFIFPLLLTQSAQLRLLTLSLYVYQGEFLTNVPGLMAAVVLSALPIFLLYLFGRRWLLAGLVGVGGK
jgi:ABC-type glycerol-3-phosphate transport system permease component